MGLPVPELVPVRYHTALPRTGIGNLRVWVPTYVFSMELRSFEKP